MGDEMATMLADNDILEIKIGTYSGNQCGINVSRWIVKDRVLAGVSDQDVAGVFSQALAVLMREVLSGTASFYGVQVKRVAPGLPHAPVVDHSHISPGIRGNKALPRQVSGIITLSTQVAGRENQGRMYVPFPDESDNVDISASPSEELKLKYNALGLYMSTVTPVVVGTDSCNIFPVLWHRESDTYTNIVGYIARPRWATQRRRGQYGAANNYPPF